MKFISQMLLALALCVGTIATPALAGDKDPLFVNLTSDESHRADMAIYFGEKQLERGHPLTMFLNDKAVRIGSKTNSRKFAEQQKALTQLMDKGAAVLICTMCMKYYGVKEADLLPGIKVGGSDLTGEALFKDNTKSISW